MDETVFTFLVGVVVGVLLITLVAVYVTLGMSTITPYEQFWLEGQICVIVDSDAYQVKCLPGAPTK